ncbi:MAG: DUF4038 domain-containing protein [bacterium]
MGIPRISWRLSLMAFALQLLLVPVARSQGVFPDSTWATKAPEEVGLSTAQLEALANYVGGRGCVVRHGYMIYGWGDQSERCDVASACKPVYAHFLLKSLEDGRIGGLDEKVSRWEPRLNEINAKLDYKDRNITWRHMANQISCYGVADHPGTAFDYNDWQMALFIDTLLLKVYGATWDNVDETVLHPQLTDILQCEDNPTFLAFGAQGSLGRFGVSVRDFARFGLLYLRKGHWKEIQLLSEDLATMAVTSPLPNSIPRTAGEEAELIPGQRTLGSRKIPDNQCDHLGSYSWLWWTNGVDRDGKRHWPDVPVDTFGAFGHGGPRAVVVFPSLDLIVSWNDSNVRGREMENQALNLLVSSVNRDLNSRDTTNSASASFAPLEGQIIVDPDHPQWLKRHGGGPFFMCGPGDPEGFLYRGSRNPDGTRNGDQMDLIEKMKGTGANCIYLMAVRSHGGDGDSTHNPFIDNNPSKGPSIKILDQWETWFTEMDNNGIVIYFFFYDDSSRVWNTGDKVENAEREYIHTLVNRFKHHKNLIWCVAEEYQEAFSPQRVSNIAAEIRAADEYGHVIAVHKHSGLSFADFADDPNIDQFAIQYNVDTASRLHDGMVTAWTTAGGKYNLNMSEASKHGTGTTCRKKNWACAMGGAYVMILKMDIANTPRSDLEDCGRLVHFFESTNFSEMAPHDELKHGGTEYILALPGDSYIAYASNLSGDIGLKDMTAGTYTLMWFDCATGKQITQTGVKVENGDRVWPKPSGIGNELAVYIQLSAGRVQ